MNLWIRSQNKEELVLATRIYLLNTNIRAIDFKGYSVNIGIYESKERAIEIIDEIQKALLPRIMVYQEKDGLKAYNQDINQKVYEMPEK